MGVKCLKDQNLYFTPFLSAWGSFCQTKTISKVLLVSVTDDRKEGFFFKIILTVVSDFSLHSVVPWRV